MPCASSSFARARPTANSPSILTSRCRKAKKTRCTTCNTRTPASARCCAERRVSDEDAARGRSRPAHARKAEALATKLADYPPCCTAARDLAPHLLPYYLREVVGSVPRLLRRRCIRVDDPALRAARRCAWPPPRRVLKMAATAGRLGARENVRISAVDTSPQNKTASFSSVA